MAIPDAVISHVRARNATHASAVGDAGMRGSHEVAGHNILLNAHPHALSPTTQDAPGQQLPNVRKGTNHGFASIHVTHPTRDKRPEHHPPIGLE